jgi:F420-dependent oxidoreductase-like protein
MRIGVGSVRIGDPTATLNDLIAEAVQAERDGFEFFSMPNIFGHDAVTVLALAGRETSRIELSTGVVPTPPRHPSALAQQALTAQAACQGRFTLGIGLSHKLVIENMLGLSYAHPAEQMREYLEVLVPLVSGKPAAFQGKHYRVQAQIQNGDRLRVPVIVAALGPKMLEVAGRLADGTATWMTGLRTLADHTVPLITAAAKRASRPAPRIVAALPIALTTDITAARSAAAKAFAIYGQLPSYRAMLDREGAAGPADVALVGDEAQLRGALRQLRDAGVTDFAASLYAVNADVAARTREFLKSEL